MSAGGTGGAQQERRSGRRQEEGILCKAPRKGVVWEQQPLQVLGPHRNADEGLWCCQLALSRPNRKRPGTFLSPQFTSGASSQRIHWLSKSSEQKFCVILMLKRHQPHRAACKLPVVIGPGAGTRLIHQPPLPLSSLLRSTQLHLRMLTSCVLRNLFLLQTPSKFNH